LYGIDFKNKLSAEEVKHSELLKQNELLYAQLDTFTSQASRRMSAEYSALSYASSHNNNEENKDANADTSSDAYVACVMYIYILFIISPAHCLQFRMINDKLCV
jgi:hypothetical protein